MKIKEIKENLNKLDEKHQDAIINLIDIKFDNLMEKTLLKMDAIQKENMLKIDSIKNEMNIQISSLKWFIVTAIAIIGIMIAFMNYSNNQRNATSLNGNNVEIKK